jgi:3-keto-5-aminohexanoate cleavage enzyme
VNPAVLTTALTGPLATKADNAALPVTPEEIAAAAKEAYEAGAAVVHVHLRDADQRPTADVEIARRTLGLIEEACPVLVQLSTGVGLGVPLEQRSKLVEVKPRMATLNVCSMTFGNGEFSNPPDGVRRLAYRMGELGVKPELELYDGGHLEMALKLHSEGLLQEPLQFSLVMGVLGGMPAAPATLVSLIDRMPEGSVWQVIGIARHNLPMTAIGLAMGGNARTGMEDTLMVRRGQPTSGNRELTARLAQTAAALDRPPATVEQAVERLRLGHSVSKVVPAA